MTEFSFIAVLIAGLPGGVDCLCMCGSIFNASAKEKSLRPSHLACGSGRIASYVAAGLLVMTSGVFGLIKAGHTFCTHGWSGSCNVSA